MVRSRWCNSISDRRFNIREVGLWAGNVMVAYANYPPTYKPSGDQGTAQIKTIRIVLQIDNTANFELKIDASIVMATVQFVDNKFNQTVTTIDKLEKITNLDTWEGRTVDTKDAGLFYYNNNSWIPSPLNNSILVTQKYCLISGFSETMKSCLTYANQNKIGTIIVAQGDYELDKTVEYTLTSAVRIVFMPNTIINNNIGETVFKLNINQKHLEVLGNSAQFPLNINPTKQIAVFDLTDYTLNKSCTISGIRTGDATPFRYDYGIKGLGLNLPILRATY